MTEEEKRDLSNYFVLARHRDDGDILIDEYEELNNIIRRNSMARLLEEARYQCIKGEISEEQYKEIEYIYIDILYGKMIDDIEKGKSL